MKRNVVRIAPVVGALFVILAVAPASGGIITHSVAFSGSLNQPSFPSIEKFDAGLGTLTEVTVAFEALGIAQIVATNPDPMDMQAEFMSVTAQAAIDSYLDIELRGRGVVTFLPTPSLTTPFSADGMGFAFVTGQGTVSLHDPLVLDAFTASASSGDTLSIPIQISDLESPQLPIATLFTQVSGTVEVSYRFSEPQAKLFAASNATVPEPSSLAVFGLGGLIMSRIRRRRC
jgi:hypothetical protein